MTLVLLLEVVRCCLRPPFQVAGYGNPYLRGKDRISRVAPDQIQESVDNSLQRLGTDYIDLLQAC